MVVDLRYDIGNERKGWDNGRRCNVYPYSCMKCTVENTGWYSTGDFNKPREKSKERREKSKERREKRRGRGRGRGRDEVEERRGETKGREENKNENKKGKKKRKEEIMIMITMRGVSVMPDRDACTYGTTIKMFVRIRTVLRQRILGQPAYQARGRIYIVEDLGPGVIVFEGESRVIKVRVSENKRSWIKSAALLCTTLCYTVLYIRIKCGKTNCTYFTIIR